nr:hypothetical protein [Gordonia phthalatica]
MPTVAPTNSQSTEATVTLPTKTAAAACAPVRAARSTASRQNDVVKLQSIGFGQFLDAIRPFHRVAAALIRCLPTTMR